MAAALTKAKEAELLNLENDEESKLLQTILAKLEQPSPAKISVVEQTNSKSQMCTWCNSMGHSMSQCFAYKRQNEEQKSYPIAKPDPNPHPTCNWCNLKGHTMILCESYKLHCDSQKSQNSRQPQVQNPPQFQIQNPPPTNEPIQTPQCPWCQRQGHLMNQCRTFKRDQLNQTNEPANATPNLNFNPTRNMRPPAPICNFCSKSGHMMQNCYAYKATNTQMSTANNTPQKPVCYHCGLPGHVIRDCRSYQREKASNPANFSRSVTFTTPPYATDPRNQTYFQNRNLPNTNPNNSLPNPTQQYRPNISAAETIDRKPKSNSPNAALNTTTTTVLSTQSPHKHIKKTLGDTTTPTLDTQTSHQNRNTNFSTTLDTQTSHQNRNTNFSTTLDTQTSQQNRHTNFSTVFDTQTSQQNRNTKPSSVQDTQTSHQKFNSEGGTSLAPTLHAQTEQQNIYTKEVKTVSEETNTSASNAPIADNMDIVYDQETLSEDSINHEDINTATSALIDHDITPPSMKIMAFIHGHPISCLVDTGSAIDAINISTFHSLPNTPTLYPPFYEAVTTVDGSNSQVFGQLDTFLLI